MSKWSIAGVLAFLLVSACLASVASAQEAPFVEIAPYEAGTYRAPPYPPNTHIALTAVVTVGGVVQPQANYTYQWARVAGNDVWLADGAPCACPLRGINFGSGVRQWRVTAFDSGGVGYTSAIFRYVVASPTPTPVPNAPVPFDVDPTPTPVPADEWRWETDYSVTGFSTTRGYAVAGVPGTYSQTFLTSTGLPAYRHPAVGAAVSRWHNTGIRAVSPSNDLFWASAACSHVWGVFGDQSASESIRVYTGGDSFAYPHPPAFNRYVRWRVADASTYEATYRMRLFNFRIAVLPPDETATALFSVLGHTVNFKTPQTHPTCLLYTSPSPRD